MKTIGQFAKDNKVTIKTLHHYEKLGILLPDNVDQENGYRYYSENESRDLRVILFLKDLGLSLSEIREVMEKDFDPRTLEDFMKFKKVQSERDLENTSKRLFKLEKIIEIVQKTENVDVKELISMSEKEVYTGKYGRGKFLELLEKSFEEAKKDKTHLSFIQMDLDHFKKVNDNFGYEVGDIVLQRTQDEIISVLQKCKFETMLERKGGDEYSVIVQASTKDAAYLATDILNAVCAVDYSDVAEDLKISISAGISGMSRKIKSYNELVHNATVKLYEAKRSR